MNVCGKGSWMEALEQGRCDEMMDGRFVEA